MNEPANNQIVIDAIQNNVVNRIAPGSVVSGEFEFAGGLLVEGKLTGNVKVTGGPFVLLQDGVFTGTVTCDKDAFLLGTVAPAEGNTSRIEIGGTLHLGSTLKADADMTAAAFNSQPGALVEGRMKTVKPAQ